MVALCYPTALVAEKQNKSMCFIPSLKCSHASFLVSVPLYQALAESRTERINTQVMRMVDYDSSWWGGEAALFKTQLLSRPPCDSNKATLETTLFWSRSVTLHDPAYFKPWAKPMSIQQLLSKRAETKTHMSN